MTIANQYLRPDGYVECRECRRAALRLIKKLNPLSYELIKSKEKKFWQFVQRVPGKNACWPWRGWKPKTIPYGRFCLGPRSIIAHRMALALKLGRLVNGMACHKCGNPACCRRMPPTVIDMAEPRAEKIAPDLRDAHAVNKAACQNSPTVPSVRFAHYMRPVTGVRLISLSASELHRSRSVSSHAARSGATSKGSR